MVVLLVVVLAFIMVGAVFVMVVVLVVVLAFIMVGAVFVIVVVLVAAVIVESAIIQPIFAH